MTRSGTSRWSQIGGAILALAAAFALAIPASASASPTWRAKLLVANHAPLTCTPWHVTVRATKGRQLLSGQVQYYYFTAADDPSGHLGANRRAGTAANSYGEFSRGIFRDTLILPSRYAANVPLDINAVVSTSYGVKTVSAVIRPRAGRRSCA